MKSLRELLSIGISELNSAGIEEAENDAWLLLEYVFNISRAQYYMNPFKQVDETVYLEKIRIRENHYPLQYITGCQWFMGFPFMVNESVLIPRQDTEILVERAAAIVGKKNLKVLDLCTGSGCIAISIDKLCQNASVTASDVSYKALEVAEHNNRLNNGNVKFIKSNLFENITGKYDIIVSNPPYIPTDVIKGLMPEVREHEPVTALDGSSDGLEFYRKITSMASKYLNSGGILIYEIGCEQAESVTDIMKNNGFDNIAVYKDLAGLDRAVECQYIFN